MIEGVLKDEFGHKDRLDSSVSRSMLYYPPNRSRMHKNDIMDIQKLLCPLT